MARQGGSLLALYSCRLKKIVEKNRGQPITTAPFPPKKTFSGFFFSGFFQDNVRGQEKSQSESRKLYSGAPAMLPSLEINHPEALMTSKTRLRYVHNNSVVLPGIFGQGATIFRAQQHHVRLL
jgi:hypothetical protein